MLQVLTVVRPGETAPERFARTLEAALEGRRAQVRPRLEGALKDRRVLFAVSLDGSGLNPEFCALLAYLRTHPGCLRGCVGGILVDGEGDLYTKSAGRDLALAASLAGCAFPGRPLEEAYRRAAADLARRVLDFAPPRRQRPRLLALHASSRPTSNTLALWSRCRQWLEAGCDITEIGLRNGALTDCAGCPYTACLHFGEREDCFYGGVMVEEVYPAIRAADGVVLLCPNYNDALPANLTAAINRLTALYRTAPFEDTAVFAIVVSGYSGGDIVASQVVSAMNMNKGFWLPPGFCMLETANDAGTAVRLPGIEERLEAFTGNILEQLLDVVK